MKDLIRREDAYKIAKKVVEAISDKQYSKCLLAYDIMDWIDDIPAVDAVVVRHGRWIQKEDKDWAGGGKTMCSRCKYGYSWKMYFEPERFKYCPNCGAKMDGEDGDNGKHL